MIKYLEIYLGDGALLTAPYEGTINDFLKEIENKNFYIVKIDNQDIAINTNKIIQAVRDTKEFDGMDDIDDFMEKLDDMKESELEVREFRGVITFKIHGE